jgi:hypothetical protein
VQLLLYRSEEAVQVDMQEAKAVGMVGRGHWACAGNYIRFLFAFNYVVSDAEWVAKV